MMLESQRIGAERDRQERRDRWLLEDRGLEVSGACVSTAEIHEHCGMWELSYRGKRRCVGFVLVGRTGLVEHMPLAWGEWWGKHWFGKEFAELHEFMLVAHGNSYRVERVTTTGTAEPI